MGIRQNAWNVFDNAFHVLWDVCAVVGLFTIPWIPGPGTEYRGLAGPVILGLVIGIVTSPMVARPLRPRLAARFPWAFRDR